MNSLLRGSKGVNVLFMAIAISSLVFSSLRMQPCACPSAGQSTEDGGKSQQTGTTSGRTLRVESGPQTEGRKIRPPRDVDRTTFSGSYWAFGSWGRVVRTSSSCWAHPSHESYAIECYHRLVQRREDLFMDIEQLSDLVATEAVIMMPNVPASQDNATEEGRVKRVYATPRASAATIKAHNGTQLGQVASSLQSAAQLKVHLGETLQAKKSSKAVGGSSAVNPLTNQSIPQLSRLKVKIQRYHFPVAACVAGSGTFEFSCIVRMNVLYVRKPAVGSASNGVAGQSPPPPEVCFITVGDWGEPRKAQRTVADTISEIADARLVKFIVSTGDNFYPAGVQSTADPQWIATFETPFSAQSVTNVRWYIALGNHDQWGYMAQKQYAEDHPRWFLPEFAFTDTVPLYGDGKKTGVESIDLAVLNSAGRDMSGQLQMADSYYDGGDARHGAADDRSRHWRLVVNHEPLYSGGLHGLLPERNAFVRSSLQPLLQQRIVHAYFNGDDHFLEIHRHLGTDFFTSGGGCGSDLYSTTVRPTTKWNMFTDYIPKDAPTIDVVVDGATKRASAAGAMLHCIEGATLKTHVFDAHGTVMHVYETAYDVDLTEYQMEVEGQ